MLTYALSLSNYAHSVLKSLPFPSADGPASAMSTEDEKRVTAGLARAVDLLCQAAGVADWTAEHVCPAVETSRTSSGGKIGKGKWPLDIGSETLRGLVMYVSFSHASTSVLFLLSTSKTTKFTPTGACSPTRTRQPSVNSSSPFCPIPSSRPLARPYPPTTRLRPSSPNCTYTSSPSTPPPLHIFVFT
jgi:hypothetical protein